MKLHDLNAEYDAVWADLIACPERAAAFDSKYADGSRASVLWHKLRELALEMRPLERDFEADLRQLFGDELKAVDPEVEENLAVDLYCALSNVQWEHEDGTRWSISFRGAGGLIAEIRETGDYMSWYCSGLEGRISEKIASALAAKGWTGKVLV